MTEKEIFKGQCPYTDKNCDKWDCQNCKVNEEEKESLKKYLEEIRGSVKDMIKLTSCKGNCTFYFEKEFFFNLTITKFKKLLKCLDFNIENFKHSRII